MRQSFFFFFNEAILKDMNAHVIASDESTFAYSLVVKALLGWPKS